jgi:DNA polymerase/3'-5' exonuclease PolX
MILTKAQKLAEKIVAELAPYCEKIQIAGSIRRQRPECSDIDLVILPKPGQKNALETRCRTHAMPVQMGGQNWILRLGNPIKPIQLDIFLADPPTKDFFQTKPGNFGSLLLCRTGSKEHNIHLIQRAKTMGLTWNPYYGIFGPIATLETLPAITQRPVKTGPGTLCLASEDEAEIFTLLGLPWIPPEQREI